MSLTDCRDETNVIFMLAYSLLFKAKTVKLLQATTKGVLYTKNLVEFANAIRTWKTVTINTFIVMSSVYIVFLYYIHHNLT